ncbi:MAG: 16S rRNA (guanine(966)-N(2))-methyltransferase RsmD [Bacteroidetes bacterium]|nr:16S rRNA (guanine(966)-N(2))-methyltransferase RsmD [Bacteroidota bacterium]MCY4232872.1 16S rRNA (guanine(966)-N(2))-methyltransferase RsmD [Bacteroidota bacterium]
MRIIAGSLRGRKIVRPKYLKTRPTTDRVKEAMFALVESRMSLQDIQLMDLFSGTGALAFEALSRGAKSATLVESDRYAILAARKNAEHLNLSQQCLLLCADAVTYLKRYQGLPMKLILADPPYEIESLSDLPNLALPCLSPGGLFVIEHDSRIEFSEHPSLNTSRGYGRTHVSIFQA